MFGRRLTGEERRRGATFAIYKPKLKTPRLDEARARLGRASSTSTPKTFASSRMKNCACCGRRSAGARRHAQTTRRFFPCPAALTPATVRFLSPDPPPPGEAPSFASGTASTRRAAAATPASGNEAGEGRRRRREGSGRHTANGPQPYAAPIRSAPAGSAARKAAGRTRTIRSPQTTRWLEPKADNTRSSGRRTGRATRAAAPFFWRASRGDQPARNP